jgi:hypothetical protein
LTGHISGRSAGKPSEIDFAAAKLFASFSVIRVPLNGAFFARELPDVTVLKL